MALSAEPLTATPWKGVRAEGADLAPADGSRCILGERAAARPLGLVATKVCSFFDIHTALRFVRRR